MESKSKIEEKYLYCPNCAHKLRSPNENYCHHCGINLTGLVTNSELKPNETQSALAKSNNQLAAYCLAYALISVAFLGFGFFLSSGLFFMWFILQLEYYTLATCLTLLVIVILNTIGFMFGIASIYRSKKVRYTDLNNSIERVGRSVGILGIITNAIACILANVFFSIHVILLLKI